MSKTRDRGEVIGDGVTWMARWSWRFLAIAIGAWLLGWVVGTFWMILLPIVLALLVTTVLTPPVGWLRQKGWPSALAAAAVMIVFVTVVVGSVAALTPSVAGQAGDIASQASDGLETIQDWLVKGPIHLSEGQLSSAIEAVQSKLQESATTIGAGIFSGISAATSVIVNIVLVLVLTFFFLKDGHKFLPFVEHVGGVRSGHHVVELFSRCWLTLSRFIRTQGLVALIDAIFIGAALLILGVPLAIPLAVLTFFGGFVPIVGAFVTGALAVLVTLVTNGLDDAIIMLVVIILVQQLEGNVLSPWLQSKNTNLHPAVVLLGVTAGGTAFGITGAFLAVPVTATLVEGLRYLDEQITRATSPPPQPQSPASEHPPGAEPASGQSDPSSG